MKFYFAKSGATILIMSLHALIVTLFGGVRALSDIDLRDILTTARQRAIMGADHLKGGVRMFEILS